MKLQQIEDVMNENGKHWSSELITLFGLWLWKRKHYGHGLLCIHGPIWGYKVGRQLKLSWDDFIDDSGMIRSILQLPYKGEHKKAVNGFALKYLELAKQNHTGSITDRIYLNTKTGKPLTTSTLNRELQTLSAQFVGELIRKYGVSLRLKPLKSNAFEVAWALKNVERYNFSKKSFIEVSKFMGHRTLKDTIKLLEIEPNDNIYFDFTGSSYITNMDSSILDNETMLKHYLSYAWDL